MGAIGAMLVVGLLAGGGGAPVQLDMRNVHFRADARVSLQIDRMRGEMVPTRAGTPVTLQDPTSYDVHLREAEVSLLPDALEAAMEEIVFADPRSAIRPTRVSFRGSDHIVIAGRLKRADIPFEIDSALSVDPDGRVRLHPTKVSGAGLPVKGLAKLFGIPLGKEAVKMGKPVGLTADGDDLLLDTGATVPPPKIVGPVEEARIENGALHLRFGRASGLSAAADSDPAPPEPHRPNRIWMHGGVLVIGRLTMKPTKMEIVDDDPSDPLDFEQLRFSKEQLPRGRERVLPDGGLVVYLPDFEDLTAPAAGR